MTTEQKRARWAIGVGTVATLGGLFALWPQVQPILDWSITNLRVVLMRDQVHAVLLSIGAGVALTIGLPWLAAWNEFTPERTRTRLRWYSGGMAFAVAWAMVPDRVGFVYAVLSGLSGTQIGMTALRWVQALLPHEKQPNSLKDDAGPASE